MYKAVGIVKNAYGEYKVRWANEIKYRTKIFEKEGCSEIILLELPQPMDKLGATLWLRENVNLNLAQDEAVEMVINKKAIEKQKQLQSKELSDRINSAVKLQKDTDPRIKSFIEKTLEKL